VNGKRIGQRLATFAFKRLQRWLIKKTPEKAEMSGAKLGRMVWKLSKKHRERALENLERAFPEYDEAKRNEVGRGVLEHFGRVMADFVRAPARTNQEVLATTEEIRTELIDEALSEGRGMLLISGHFGNWERLAHWFSAKGYKLTIVVRDANDPELNQLVLDLRHAAGIGVISRGDAIQPIYEALGRNEIIGILPDQNSEEIFIPFFGKPCGTVKGPAVIARRRKAPVVAVYCPRIGVNRYQAFAERIEPLEGYEPIEGMTRAINLSLENAIRKHPEQYLWIHNRWKSAKKRGLV